MSIHVLKTDNARDFFNSTLGPYLFSNGNVHQSTCVDTPQQNGVAECKNRYLLEVARSLLCTSNIPKRFGGKQYLLHLCKISSRTLSKISSSITYSLKVFRCSDVVHSHSLHQGKLDARVKKMHLYREYSSNNKGYKCYYPTSKKFVHSMDVSFFENIPYFSNFVIQGESHNHESYNWEWPSLIESNQPITQSNQNWNRPISLPLPHHGVSPQMPLVIH